MHVYYILRENKLYLVADNGTSYLGGFAPGSANVISNSHGSLDCSKTTVTNAGESLTVSWSVSATSAPAGSNTITLRARDRACLDTLYRDQRRRDLTVQQAALAPAEAEP